MALSLTHCGCVKHPCVIRCATLGLAQQSLWGPWGERWGSVPLKELLEGGGWVGLPLMSFPEWSFAPVPEHRPIATASPVPLMVAPGWRSAGHQTSCKDFSSTSGFKGLILSSDPYDVPCPFLTFIRGTWIVSYYLEFAQYNAQKVKFFISSQIWLYMAWRRISWYLWYRGKHMLLDASETAIIKNKKINMRISYFSNRHDLGFQSFQQGGGGGSALAPILPHRAWEQKQMGKSRCQIAN